MSQDSIELHATMGRGVRRLVIAAEAEWEVELPQARRADNVVPFRPRESRLAVEQQATPTATAAYTFRSAAEAYIAANRSDWKSAKHAEQWTATLDALRLSGDR
jgi:hypothetical protein